MAFTAKLFAILVIAGMLLVVLLAVCKVPLFYNFRNLVVRWRTTLLTAAAFVLVISLLTVMLAFVNGMYRLTQGSGQPGNVIVLSDGATDEMFSNIAYGDTSDVERQPGVLRDENGKPLCSKEVYLIVNQPIPGAVAGGRKRRFLSVRGVDDPAMSSKVHGLPLHAGGAWFAPAGVQPIPRSDTDGQQFQGRTAVQAILGEGVARELGRDQGKPTLEVGDLFSVGPRKWVVVGILQSAGSTFDSEIWAKKQVIGPLFGKENYTSLVLRTQDAEQARTLAEYLSKNFKKAALQAQLETEYFNKLNATNQQFLWAIGFVAVILAIGGVFGVMNTMFAAVSQRIHDIGVLRILGFSPRQILISFFVESLVIALIGGLIGCALGYLTDGWTASSIVSGGQGGGKSVVLKLVVDAKIITGGVILTLIMGALGGFFPAWSAMRLKPLESLR